MRTRVHAWLRLFRVVNLPTVPGDVFAGAALASCTSPEMPDWCALAAASLASVLLYMFGLADNDIVGAAIDTDRPIPQGLISLRAAHVARALCLLVAIGLGLVARLPQTWWPVAGGLTLAIIIYNRTKWPLMMGLCRGVNLVLGAAAIGDLQGDFLCAVMPFPVFFAFLLFTAYIAAVTKYSEGEEKDPARKRRVGRLIGALVWLQLAAIFFLEVINEVINVGADFDARSLVLIPLQLAMIALLFLFKYLMPKVSAS